MISDPPCRNIGSRYAVVLVRPCLYKQSQNLYGITVVGSHYFKTFFLQLLTDGLVPKKLNLRVSSSAILYLGNWF